jgi:hypothetical protein
MIENFIKSLKSSPKKSGVFNPWWESDKDHDISAQAPAIRRRQLFHYAILNQIGFKSIKVRHPANAGARKFRQQFSYYIDKPAT